MTTALITGASSGIGVEFAKIHAARSGDLVLVARRENLLLKLKEELEQKFNINVFVIVADLSLSNAAEEIFKQTVEAGIKVDILINNAGFGGYGEFHNRQLEDDRAMMQVNMFSLVSLTHLYLQGMLERRQGKILNVASTAGFLPGPLQAVYYATKAFVKSFSLATAEELRHTGITATALCPGPVHSGFVKAGHLEGVKAWKNAAKPDVVAKLGYEAMLNGDLLVINDQLLRFLIHWVVPFLPLKTLLKASRQLMERA